MSRERNRSQKNNVNNGMGIGLIFFLVIFAYIIVAIFNFFTKKHIESFQVNVGALSTNNIYKGVALRDETIVRSPLNGYVNYFAREGERVGAGNLVYTLDESGKVANYLENSQEESVLSEHDLSELKTDIVNFVNTFDTKNFSTLYDFKYNVEGTVLKLSNSNLLSDIQKINNSGVSSLVNFNYSPATGYVVYSIDGYEDLSVSDMTSDLIDYTKYETDSLKKQLVSNSLVGEGDPVYKLSTNEDWSIVIMTDAEKADSYLAEKYIKVKFLKNQNTSWGKVSTFLNEAGECFVELSFNNSMLAFCTDRFIDIELILDDKQGLKVPNSSIVTRMFYIIPKKYLYKGNQDNGTDYVLKRKYLEDGTPSTENVPVIIYGETEESYYIDKMNLSGGDVLLLYESQDDSFSVDDNKVGDLTGVYNINKGYADFKKIDILYQNDEYSIIQPNQQYGLSAYDYIVLDASTVHDEELLYD